MYLALDHELVIVQVTVVSSNTEVMTHILAAQTLLTGHQGLEQLLAVTGANDVRTGVAEEMLDSLCQITNGGSVCLLDEQVAGVGVLEGEHNQIHSLVQIHQEAGHVGVGDGDGIAGLNLVNEQRNDGTAAAHNVAVTGAADGGTATLSSHTGVSVDDMLHHGLGDTHSVDGVSGFIGGQADDTLDTCINSSVQDVIGTDDVGLDGLHGEELAGGNLLQSGSVEDVVNAGHGVTDRLGVADITDVELDLLGVLRVLGLKLMAHIVLLLFVTGEDTDLLQVRIQEVLQNGRTKRTSTTSDHKGCVIKCRHFYFLLSIIVVILSYKILFLSFLYAAAMTSSTITNDKNILYSRDDNSITI